MNSNKGFVIQSRADTFFAYICRQDEVRRRRGSTKRELSVLKISQPEFIERAARTTETGGSYRNFLRMTSRYDSGRWCRVGRACFTPSVRSIKRFVRFSSKPLSEIVRFGAAKAEGSGWGSGSRGHLSNTDRILPPLRIKPSYRMGL